MEIVQLSDIHVGSQFREDVFEKVIKEVNSLKPDSVITVSYTHLTLPTNREV